MQVAAFNKDLQAAFTCPHCGYVWVPKIRPPNYCAKCSMPLSRWAKEVARERAKRSALRKISDVEKFKEMWLDGENYERIAEAFGLNKAEVYFATVALGLPRRGKGFWLMKYWERKKEEDRERVIEFLREKGGYCTYREAIENLSRGAIQDLLLERVIFKVSFSLRRGAGAYKRRIEHKIFKEDFVPKAIRGEGIKSFLCLGRTGVVRLMQKALRTPENVHVQKTLTAFLRQYLTEAERVAVMWHLGVYGVSPKKRSVRIFGTIPPVLT